MELSFGDLRTPEFRVQIMFGFDGTCWAFVGVWAIRTGSKAE